MTMTCDRVRELAPGFVLGALDPDEMIEVQDHLDGCDQPHPEIAELGGVVPYIAQSLLPVEPPSWLRDSVIAAARADSRARQRVGKATEHRMAEHAPAVVPAAAPAAAAEPAAEAQPTPARVISFRGRVWARRGQITRWTSRVAAALLVVSLAGYAYVVQLDLNRTKTQVPSIVYAMGPGSQQTRLAPTDTSARTGGFAVLQPTGHLFVDVHDLSVTTGDQVYMVWATGQNGDVSNVGSFKIDATGSAQLEFDNVPNAPSLWLFICREPNGKVTKPTGPIILSGTLSA